MKSVLEVFTHGSNYEQLGIDSLNIASGRGVKAKHDTFSEENIKLLKEEIALHPQNLKEVITELSEKFNIDLTVHKLKEQEFNKLSKVGATVARLIFLT
jgi:hypothetical protein